MVSNQDKKDRLQSSSTGPTEEMKISETGKSNEIKSQSESTVVCEGNRGFFLWLQRARDMRETQPDFSPCSLRVVEMASAFIVCNNQRRIIKDFHSNFSPFQLDSTSVQR